MRRRQFLELLEQELACLRSCTWPALALLVAACGPHRTAVNTEAVTNAVTGTAITCAADDSDPDLDGLSSSCELEFAQAFAPILVTESGGCNWDVSVEPARLGGEYLYVVGEPTPGRIRIGYLPAYYRDCGWSGLKCRIPFVDCSPHNGDSEAIFIDVVRAPRSELWQVDAIFLSAHCFGRGSDCRWYRGAELDAFEWVGARRGAAVVWVAEGRQANYPSTSACDAGHFGLDTCDRNSVGYRFPIRSGMQNIGSRVRPLGAADGCITAASLGSRSEVPVPGIEECFWSSSAGFGGWLPRSREARTTPYERYLRETGGF